MNMQSIGLEASLTPGAKKKIDDGTWRLIGVTVQDTTSGKMVANLKTVAKEEGTYYTPALFVAIQNEICVSQQLISEQVREEFQRLNESFHHAFSQVEGKIDFQTDIVLGALIGEINHFFLQFHHLHAEEANKADTVLELGGSLAARLAGMTDVLIRDYLGEVRLTVSLSPGETVTMSYKNYQAQGSTSRAQCYGTVTEMEYPDLLISKVKKFIPALVEIFNRLNILSVCFHQELYMGYQDSLMALRSKLNNFLYQLVFGVEVKKAEFDDYAQRVFGKDPQGCWIYENEADRLAKHYDDFSRNNLGARNFCEISARTATDWNLINSVSEVLNLIDNVDNLQHRGNDLQGGTIHDTESVKLLRESIFPPRQKRLSLPDKGIDAV